MDRLAEISQEIAALDLLIYRFGQANQTWFNPEMVRRLNRAKRRAEAERAEWQARRAEVARFI